MRSARGPQRLGDALSELVALKGLARSGATEQLSAALMYELDSFHKSSLLEALREQPGLEINRLKFRLKGSLGESTGSGN